MKDRIEALWQIMQAFAQYEVTEDALSEAMLILRAETGAGDMTVWMRDPEQDRIVAIAHAGDDNVTGYSVEPDSSLLGEVMATGEEIWLPDASSNRHFQNGLDEVTGLRVRNCFLIPMKLAGKTVGCLQIINRPEGEYTDSERSALRGFCGLAAMVADEKGIRFPGKKDRKVILSLRNAVKEFPSGDGQHKVLKGINLDIYEDEFLVILGESGCGKSTMLNILGGIDTLTSGELSADGQDLTQLSENKLSEYRRDTVGFVFQSYNLMPNLTALENIEFVAENTPDHKDPRETLEMVGLAGQANKYPGMLSGGQQQRVAIARAIVKRPRVILADEPTGALDYSTSIEVLRVIEKLVREEKTTVVMVTHNYEIARMADRVIRMRDGRIGSIRENAWPRSAEELVW